MSRGRTLAIVLALLVLNYVGGYFALSDPVSGGIDIGGGGIHQMQPHYRTGGGVARAVYSPLEAIDRQVRPTLWAPRVHTCAFDIDGIEAELREQELRR